MVDLHLMRKGETENTWHNIRPAKREWFADGLIGGDNGSEITFPATTIPCGPSVSAAGDDHKEEA